MYLLCFMLYGRSYVQYWSWSSFLKFSIHEVEYTFIMYIVCIYQNSVQRIVCHNLISELNRTNGKCVSVCIEYLIIASRKYAFPKEMLRQLSQIFSSSNLTGVPLHWKILHFDPLSGSHRQYIAPLLSIILKNATIPIELFNLRDCNHSTKNGLSKIMTLDRRELLDPSLLVNVLHFLVLMNWTNFAARLMLVNNTYNTCNIRFVNRFTDYFTNSKALHR